MDHLQPLYGVDRKLVEAAMRRARKERSEAFWSMMQAVFGRRADRDDASATAPRQMPSSAQLC
jgi:hypothetical protein